MKSKFRIAVVAAALCATVGYSNLPAIASNDALLIRPGHQLGRLRLQNYPKGMPLPSPDYTDGAMFQYNELWMSRKTKNGLPVNTLLAHITSNAPVENGGPGYRLSYVRATSRIFHDRHGLRTGRTLATIRRVYRHLAAVDGIPTILADDRLGISFEFDAPHPSGKSRCIAIAIYTPGSGILQHDASDVCAMVADSKSSGRHK